MFRFFILFQYFFLWNDAGTYDRSTSALTPERRCKLQSYVRVQLVAINARCAAALLVLLAVVS